jgi:hypothetical protein
LRSRPPINDLESAVLIYETLGALFRRFHAAVIPPVFELSIVVPQPSVGIEAVCDFVADDHAGCAVG